VGDIVRLSGRKPPGRKNRRPPPREKRPPFRYGIPVVIVLAAALAWLVSPPPAIDFGNHEPAQSETRDVSGVRSGLAGEGSRVQSGDAHRVTFAMCGTSTRENCVVDGDTFYFRGDKIRVADIDAPEMHPPRCDYEARLGDQATGTLLALLNAGPFTLADNPDGRDEDRYGRKLRIVVRDGASIGAMLVARGLARTWTGQRQPWCT
jgi:endonuclease YncB( thermonuclease family)